MAAYRAALARPVTGLEDLEAVLGAARALEEGAVQWELDCADLEERFRCCMCSLNAKFEAEHATSDVPVIDLMQGMPYRTRLVHAAEAGLDTETFEAEHAEAGLLQGQRAALQSNARLVREGLKHMVDEHQQAAGSQVKSSA